MSALTDLRRTMQNYQTVQQRKTKVCLLLAALLLGGLALVAVTTRGEDQAAHAAALDSFLPAGGTSSPTPACPPSWNIVTSANNGARTNILNGVTGSGNDVWAVGYYRSDTLNWQTLTTHWDGTAWSVVASPNSNESQDNFLTAVTGSGSDVWAVGYYLVGPFPNGIPHKQTIHWDGSAWTQVASPSAGTSATLTAVTGSGSDVWAVGQYTNNQVGQTFTMHWDGTAWSIMASPNVGTGQNYLNGVTGSGNDVWAVGYYNITSLTLTMHWDGTTWAIVTSPNVGKNTNVLLGATGSGNDVWAAGNYSDNDDVDHTLTLHWDGSAWSHIDSPNVEDTGDILTGVTGSGSDVWAAGLYSAGGPDQNLSMHWDGIAWSLVTTPDNGTAWNQISGITGSGNDVWAVGYYESSSINRTLTLHWSSQCTTGTPTQTLSPTSTSTGTPIVSNTPTSMATSTAPAPTHTVVPTATSTSMSTPTSTPTIANTVTATHTATGTPAATLTGTASTTPVSTSTATICTITFSDVPEGSTFYPFVQCLACRGIINGYADGTFRPNSDVTRGQLSKIVSNAAGFGEPQTTLMFADVPPGAAFQVYINRLASRGYITGYPCGGLGENCVPPGNPPYFRPSSSATRGQISKIVSNAAGFDDTPGAQIFEDVVTGSTFYSFVQRLANRDVMSGYPCGGTGEPCVSPGDRPYFRPNHNATRGQVSKIVSNTFFPGCAAP